jgi:uncharacterized protein (DUF1015 family)
MEAQVAALPYDVYDRAEAQKIVTENPRSFLAIDRAETQFGADVDAYAPEVYAKAKELLWRQIREGIFLQEETPCYYLYEQVMDGRSQSGIAACVSIDDYERQVVKKHESTRVEKEEDRIRHVDACGAQTGPIFLAYAGHPQLKRITAETKLRKPVYDFATEDGILHKVWVIRETEQIEGIREAFEEISSIYIADGHHRCASAVKVGLKRRARQPQSSPDSEFNFFLAVLFPGEELRILDYNRVVKDLNGYSVQEFLRRVERNFEVREAGNQPYRPFRKGTFGMYLRQPSAPRDRKGRWYELTARETFRREDVVAGLDVSVLQEDLLRPVLGIEDPKTDKRIDFVGGIRGLEELERRVHTDMAAAFSLYPTSIGELFAVAEAGKLMPPKSTWFEPKLRSGLLIHGI